MMQSSLRVQPKGDHLVRLIAVLALPLFLYGLGNTYLWQDEAQTALLGRSVLAHGVPMVGQGSESISAVGGRDAGIRGIYFQVSWLQAYVVAASLNIFGESSWSARVPFALAGWLCIPLGAWALRQAGATRTASRIAALLTALSVPFIICSRQSRYYALAAALTLLAAGTYAALSHSARPPGDRRIPVSVSFAAAASLLVVSFDITAIGVLGALAVHWTLLRPGHAGRWNISFWTAWGFACFVLAVWLASSFTAASRHEHGGLGSLAARLRYGALYYAGQINAHIVPLPMLMTLAAVWRTGVAGVSIEEVSGNRRAATLLVLVALGGVAGAALSPHRFFRYIVPVYPILICLLATGLGSMWSLGRWGRHLAAVTVVAFVSTNALFVWSHAALSALARGSGLVTVRDRPKDYQIPLLLLMREFRDPPRGPIAATVDYLREHARTDDVLVTTYGDLPLKFHTGLRIYGGETGQLPPAHIKVDWIWPRNVTVYAEVRATAEWITLELSRGGYRRVELPVVDRRWENREDPEEHIFSNPGPGGPPVVLYRAAE